MTKAKAYLWKYVFKKDIKKVREFRMNGLKTGIIKSNSGMIPAGDNNKDYTLQYKVAIMNSKQPENIINNEFSCGIKVLTFNSRNNIQIFFVS